MLIKSYRIKARTLAVSSLLLGSVLTAPVCTAGGALIIVPAEDSDVPQGNQIPQRRIDDISRQVSELKARLQSEAERQDTPSTSN